MLGVIPQRKLFEIIIYSVNFSIMTWQDGMTELVQTVTLLGVRWTVR